MVPSHCLFTTTSLTLLRWTSYPLLNLQASKYSCYLLIVFACELLFVSWTACLLCSLNLLIVFAAEGLLAVSHLFLHNKLRLFTNIEMWSTLTSSSSALSFFGLKRLSYWSTLTSSSTPSCKGGSFSLRWSERSVVFWTIMHKGRT